MTPSDDPEAVHASKGRRMGTFEPGNWNRTFLFESYSQLVHDARIGDCIGEPDDLRAATQTIQPHLARGLLGRHGVSERSRPRSRHAPGSAAAAR